MRHGQRGQTHAAIHYETVQHNVVEFFNICEINKTQNKTSVCLPIINNIFYLLIEYIYYIYTFDDMTQHHII